MGDTKSGKDEPGIHLSIEMLGSVWELGNDRMNPAHILHTDPSQHHDRKTTPENKVVNFESVDTKDSYLEGSLGMPFLPSTARMFS